jgi:saccharopine dehydrogenase-like NADP-dependent oxidoreductase
MHRVLVLGAGMVAKPLIDYLLDKGCMIKIACNTCSNAQRILKEHPGGEIVYWDADNTAELKPMVKEADIVVSLLPYRFHCSVAEVCIEYRKPMVTTSYVREEMAELDKAAREAGIIILNEAGLDPGIDHMSAMKIIDRVKDEGGVIEKFWSICGALPSPEYADNPLGYKFTWSPEGVLLASLNDARYLDKGQIVEVKPDDLFKKTFDYEIKNVGALEVYANRDSISYIDIYGLGDIKTIFRGTFRFRGWC